MVDFYSIDWYQCSKLFCATQNLLLYGRIWFYIIPSMTLFFMSKKRWRSIVWILSSCLFHFIITSTIFRDKYLCTAFDTVQLHCSEYCPAVYFISILLAPFLVTIILHCSQNVRNFIVTFCIKDGAQQWCCDVS